MQKSTIVLLSTIFVTLITCSVQSVTADHLELGQGIYIDEERVQLAPTRDSNYQVYLQVVIRSGDDQLINVTESMQDANYLPHQITDQVFDTLMGEKEIITIDNIKYEKVQYTFSPTLEQRTVKTYPIFEELPIEYVVEEDARAQMKEDIRDYYRWVIPVSYTHLTLPTILLV